MHKSLFTLLSYLFLVTFVSAQSPVKEQLLLLSNLGELAPDDPLLDRVDTFLRQQTTMTHVLFLGDFIDQNGIGETPNQRDLAKMQRLFALGSSATHLYFIPGDREWDDGNKKGLKKMKALTKYFEQHAQDRHHLLDERACPGPQVAEIGTYFKIVAMDTQWFVHKFKKPLEEQGGCEYLNPNELWAALEDEIEAFDNRQIIVAGHHPVISYGGYAGYRQTKRYLTPPVIGSFIGAFRQNVGTTKDLAHEALRDYAGRMTSMLELYPGIIYASGHEYDRQINLAWENYHINSGAIARSTDIGLGEFSHFREDSRGFTMLGITENGEVRAKVYGINQQSFPLDHEEVLYQSPIAPKSSSIPVNKWFEFDSNSPTTPPPSETLDFSAVQQYAANPGYRQKGKLIRWLMGEHYRKSWAKPVQVPYLPIDTLGGGLRPYRKGGGAQTRSLKFKSADGRYYSFRSIDKYPTQKKDKDLYYGVLGDLYRDLTTSQHPYGPAILGPLMDSLDIPHPMANLYLLPDHPQLGLYRQEYKNMLGWLELRPKDAKKGKPFRDARKVYHTFEMYKKLIKDHDHQIDKEAFAWARLFDMWIMDWDRHQKNWDWLAYGDKKAMTFLPFPKDRDRALTRMQGVFQVMDWPMISREMVRFRKSLRGLKSLNYKNQSMDRFLLYDLQQEDWLRLVQKFQELMTDEVIDQATQSLPPEVYPYSGATIADILKSRRDRLPKLLRNYYQMLAKYIFVIGTNDKEHFELTRQSNGDVLVEVYKLKKGKKGDLISRRLCLQKETREIRVYGLGDEDVIHIKGAAKKRILIRVIGGKGKDRITEDSRVSFIGRQTKIYDFEKKDSLQLGKEGKLKQPQERINLELDRFFRYNYFLALPSIYFNADDGLGFRVTGQYTRQRFNKPDFGARYNFSLLGTTRGNYSLNASVRYRHVVRKWDLNLGVSFNRPDRSQRQFFGFGNELVINDSLLQQDFYQNRMETINGRIGLQHTYRQNIDIQIDLNAERRKVFPDPVAEGNSIYDNLDYLNTTLVGSRQRMNMDFRDNPNFPRRGAQLIFDNYSFLNSDADWKLGGRLEAIFSNYYSLGKKRTLTLGLKGGYRHAYGETPFYYRSFIGQFDNIRGYRRNRFGGRSAAWLNSELRAHLGVIKTPIVPLYYGIFGFFDTGRVWVSNDNSDKWHHAHGGGFYLQPYQDNFSIVFTAARSEQEDLQITFGVGFFVR